MKDLHAAVKLLTSMMRDETGSPKPDAISFNTVRRCEALPTPPRRPCGQPPSRAAVQIDTRTWLKIGFLAQAQLTSLWLYAQVISALANANQPDKAENLLTSMLDTGLEADAISFTAVISGFAKASQPELADKWLQRMLQSNVPPDTMAFNAV